MRRFVIHTYSAKRHFWRDDLRVVRLAPRHPRQPPTDQTELVPPGNREDLPAGTDKQPQDIPEEESDTRKKLEGRRHIGVLRIVPHHSGGRI